MLPEQPSPQRKISDKITSAIKTWLDDCHRTHSRCNSWAEHGLKSSPSSQEPARLVSIQDESGYIRLVDRTSIPSIPCYATLSHCWGSSMPVRLTKRTCTQLYEGVKSSILPPTFSDAVQIARQLGLAFLWIDALCIIQDSDGDWQTEAPKMAFIYSQSYVNLAAMAAYDSSDGLVCQKATFEIICHHLSTSWSGVETDHGDVILEPSSSYNRFVDDAPLYSRAWVLQERVLAPRSIQFSADMIRWHCHEVQASETRPQGGETNEIDIIQDDSWEDIVSSYSGLNLSRRNDKLVAIAGIARVYGQIHNVSPGDYLAGLWRSGFPCNLLWRASLQTEPCDYRAPSWSWASVDFRLRFLIQWEHDETPEEAFESVHLCNVIEAETTTVTSDPFSSVTGGLLRCQGCLYKVTLICHGDKSGGGTMAQYVVIGQSLELVLAASEEEVFAIREGVFGGEETNNDEETLTDCAKINLDRTDLDVEDDLQDVWFLPVVCGQSEGAVLGEFDGEDRYRQVDGILVIPENDQKGVFKRVGHLMARQKKNRWVEAIWRKCVLEERLYDKDLGNGQYEFILI